MPLDVGNVPGNAMGVYHVLEQFPASVGYVEVGTGAILALVATEDVHNHKILLCIVLRQTHGRV